MNRVFERRNLDRKLKAVKGSIPERPAKGWLYAIRNALGMTASQLGERLNIAQSSITELEQSEQKNSISLKTLERVADALGCDVKYILVPRIPLTEMVMEQGRKFYSAQQEATRRTMVLEDQLPNISGTDSSVELAMTLLKNERRIWNKK